VHSFKFDFNFELYANIAYTYIGLFLGELD
jgi:hypothetical protein